MVRHTLRKCGADFVDRFCHETSSNITKSVAPLCVKKSKNGKNQLIVGVYLGMQYCNKQLHIKAILHIAKSTHSN